MMHAVCIAAPASSLLIFIFMFIPILISVWSDNSVLIQFDLTVEGQIAITFHKKKNEITLEYSIIIVVSRLDFNHIEMLFISYDH